MKEAIKQIKKETKINQELESERTELLESLRRKITRFTDLYNSLGCNFNIFIRGSRKNTGSERFYNELNGKSLLLPPSEIIPETKKSDKNRKKRKKLAITPYCKYVNRIETRSNLVKYLLREV